MILVSVKSVAASKKLQQIALALSDTAFDQPVEIAAWKCRTELIQLTPKKWTGMLRRNWCPPLKLADGQRLIFNSTDGDPKHPNKILLWLERGTGNAGSATSKGGYIYPKTARVLFVPLTSRAALGGYEKGMVFGKDYVLAKRVRGIKARWIVKNYRPKARAVLKAEIKAFIERAIQ